MTTHHLMNTYNRQPVTFVRGEGAFLWDTEGKRYLDAIMGVAVCGLGHAQPDVAEAICDQARTLIHTSNIYGIAWQESLADRLAAISGMDKVFFCNSGAEANEAAIKLARLHGHRKGLSDPHIVVMESSFHGRTLATLSATGNRKVQAGFEPLVSGFVRVPYGDLEKLRQVAAHDRNIVAVLVEPVQGEGGIRVPPASYLQGIRELCDTHGWLMMVDEVQTGIGRTGAWFGFQHSGILPDVMSLAKGLGNGVPIGACLAAGAAAELFGPGNHGSTFGGNPLACRVAHTVLEVIERDGLLARATELGQRIRDGLSARLQGVAGVLEVRGLGLMIGLQLDRPCAPLVGQALEQGLLINVTADSVVRLLPALVMTDEQTESLIAQLAELITAFLAQGSKV
ncbi:MAG: aspartate aminotransferase family protein [Gammaproteobacteria bacterium 28-57-27]|nr:MAG: aspartate aminotransferase family protein [Gammaproteobacteria bacterium 28-57-27]